MYKIFTLLKNTYHKIIKRINIQTFSLFVGSLWNVALIQSIVLSNVPIIGPLSLSLQIGLSTKFAIQSTTKCKLEYLELLLSLGRLTCPPTSNTGIPILFNCFKNSSVVCLH